MLPVPEPAFCHATCTAVGFREPGVWLYQSPAFRHRCDLQKPVQLLPALLMLAHKTQHPFLVPHLGEDFLRNTFFFFFPGETLLTPGLGAADVVGLGVGGVALGMRPDTSSTSSMSGRLSLHTSSCSC